MSAMLAPTTEPPVADGRAVGGDNQQRFEALCRLIQRGQGRFVFALVEFDLPGLRRQTLERLQQELGDLKLTTVEFAPPPEGEKAPDTLAQLKKLVKSRSLNRTSDALPDALIVTGLENLFPQSLKSDSPAAAAEAAHALQPLNLGRNLLAETFPCPVLFCLPPAAMRVFQLTAPDLTSWKSGFFSFRSDPDAIRAKAVRAAKRPLTWLTRWLWRRHSPDVLRAEADQLSELITDAEALSPENGPDKATLARLHHRLGWLSVTLANRQAALNAFNAALEDNSDQRLAESAKQGLEQAKRLQPSVSPERLAELRKIFRGAAALGEEEGIYGRDDQLHRLTAEVTKDRTRFYTVWGVIGSGKTSLVTAGLVPELNRLGHYLPVIVRQWESPVENIRHALSAAAGIPLDGQTRLHDCVQQVYEQTNKTVVIICDQFEQFFDVHQQQTAREPALTAISECVNSRLRCKFIFLLREDGLGHMVEFDSDVLEPLEKLKRFHLPLFADTDAERVLRQLKARAGLNWPPSLIQTVVHDLTRDNRVRPIELQLVAASLAASGITSEPEYERAGHAAGLLDDYLQLMLADLSASQSEQRLMKLILLALVDEPPRRLALHPVKIVELTGISLHKTTDLLARLAQVNLVRQAESYAPATSDAPIDPAAARYELMHDFLIDSVLRITRNLQDNRRQARRLLVRAKEDLTIKPRHTVSLRQWWLISRNGDPKELQQPEVIRLLRRSLRWVIFTRMVLPVLALVTGLWIVQNASGHVTIERDFADRIIVRRGLPYLGFLPVIGNQELLDTGYTVDDIAPNRRVVVEGLLHWEWRNLQSRALIENQLVYSFYGGGRPALLFYRIGDAKRCLDFLSKAQNYEDSGMHSSSFYTMARIVRSNPDFIPDAISPLFAALKNSASEVRSSALYALTEIVKADPKRASSALEFALVALKDSESDVRSSAFQVLTQIVKADPKQASGVFEPTLTFLKVDESYVRNSAVITLAQILKADPKRTSDTFGFVLAALKDGEFDTRRVAINTLAEIVKADPKRASDAFTLILDALKDSRSSVRISAVNTLAETVKADPKRASEAFPLTLDALKDSESSVRSSAVTTLAQILKADPKRNSDAINFALTALKNSSSDMRYLALDMLAQILKADSKQLSDALPLVLAALKDSNSDVCKSALDVLTQIVRTEPKRAFDALAPAIALLKNSNSNVRKSAITLLAQIVKADAQFAKDALQIFFVPTQTYQNPFTDGRNDGYSAYEVGQARKAAGNFLGELARLEPVARQRAFELLTDFDQYGRAGLQESLPDLFVADAESAVQQGRDPLTFLFDHLEGRQSYLPQGNANTFAVYRRLLVTAMARWLVSDSEIAKKTQAGLEQRLIQMRDTDKRLHLRIAAWDALAEAARLKEEKALQPAEDQ